MSLTPSAGRVIWLGRMMRLLPESRNWLVLAKAPPLRVTPAMPVTATPSGTVTSPVTALTLDPACSPVLSTRMRRVGKAVVSTLATTWLGM